MQVSDYSTLLKNWLIKLEGGLRMNWFVNRKKTTNEAPQDETHSRGNSIVSFIPIREEEIDFYHELRNRKKWIIAILIVMATWGMYFSSPLSRPKEIEVVGTFQLTPEEVLSNGGISKQQSTWGILWREEKIKQALLDRLEKVSDVSLHIKGFRNLVVTVVENPAMAIFEAEGKYFEILKDQTVIEVESNQIDDLYPNLVNFEKDLALKITKGLDDVPASILSLIKEIRYVNDKTHKNRIEMKMRDGMQITADLTNIGSKIIYYPQIRQEIGNKKGKLDMEVGIFFTPNP